MANIKSQKKRIITNEKAHMRNRAVKSELKTAVRRVRDAVAAKDAEAAYESALKACRLLDKAASKGVIHKNQAANRKSGVMALANTIVTDEVRAAYKPAPKKEQAATGNKKAAAKAARKEAMAAASAEKAKRREAQLKAEAKAAKKKAEAEKKANDLLRLLQRKKLLNKHLSLSGTIEKPLITSGFFVFRESRKLQQDKRPLVPCMSGGVVPDASTANSKPIAPQQKTLYRESAFTTHKRNASSGCAPDFMACSVSRKAVSALLNSPEENLRA